MRRKELRCVTKAEAEKSLKLQRRAGKLEICLKAAIKKLKLNLALSKEQLPPEAALSDKMHAGSRVHD